MHTILAVNPKPATEKGALDGFEAACSCGYHIPATFQGLAAQWGREHAAYMNAKEAPKAKRGVR